MTDRNDQLPRDASDAQSPDAIDAYLDGLLPPTAKEAFERRALDDARLRDEIGRARTVETSLRGSFAPPSADRIATILHRAMERVPEDVQTPETAGRINGEVVAIPAHPGTPLAAAAPRIRRMLALAAMITILVAGTVLLLQWQSVFGRRPYLPPSVNVAVASGPRAMPLDEIYREQVAGGMQPGWVCKDNQEFGTYFAGRLGQTVWLDHSAALGAQWLGVSFTGGVSELTIGVLAKVDGQPVLVFADRAATPESVPLLKDAKELHLHKRQLGSLVLYELSPLAKPRLLDAFYTP